MAVKLKVSFVSSMQIFPESLILPWESITFEDIPLGVGNFGQVVKAVIEKDGKLIQTAVKMLKGKLIANISYLGIFIRQS